jgi:hypothetical protein
MPFSKRKIQAENTCYYCLYLKPPPGSHHNKGGNCALHREWIDRATRTTCSEMSNQRLQAGIYQLSETARGEWIYTRRSKRIRTRLFLVAKG